MTIILDPAAIQREGTLALLRQLEKANEQEWKGQLNILDHLIDDLRRGTPNGWKQTLDDCVIALKAANIERKEISEAILALG